MPGEPSSIYGVADPNNSNNALDHPFIFL